MPRIMFDNKSEKNAWYETEEKKISRNPIPEKERFDTELPIFHNSRKHAIGTRPYNKRPNCRTRTNAMSSQIYDQNKFPIWVACALFSLLGAFAIFAPICGTSQPYNGEMIHVSFTPIDLYRMGVSSPKLNVEKFEIYFSTTIAFAVSFAASIIMREKINDKPYLLMITGLIAIAGIFIPFDFEAVFKVIAEYNGICFVIQLVCAAMIITINAVPFKRFLEERGMISKK